MDRHKEQKNRFELQETVKNLLSGNVKCLRLEPQDKKTKVSKLMLDNFASSCGTDNSYLGGRLKQQET